MHLFFIKVFPELDSIAPICHYLNKDKQLNGIYSLYPFQDYSNTPLIKALKKGGTRYLMHTNNDILFFFLSKLYKLFYFFKIDLNKFNFIWRFFFFNYSFINNKKLRNYIIKNNVKTFLIDEAFPKKHYLKLQKIANIYNITTIQYQIGYDFVKRKKINKYFNKECDYYLLSNISSDDLLRYNNNKLKYLGNLRFQKDWIQYLDEIYETKINFDSKKINVAILLRPSRKIFDQDNHVIKNLKNDKRFNLQIIDKPRFINFKKYDKQNTLFTSQYFKWSDVVISHSTSVMIEVIQRNKPLLFLSYLLKDKDLINEEYVFLDYDSLFQVDSTRKLFEILEDMYTNKAFQKYIRYDNKFINLCLNSKEKDINAVKSHLDFFREIVNN